MVAQELYPQQLVTETAAAELLADPWSIKVIGMLAHGRQRFTQLQRSLRISSKTLSKRLKELENQAIITRTLYAQVPLRVEYELTEKGHELKELFDEIVKWDRKWS
jgi:DNA-binding HxlR family transcriptional regulator